MPSLTHVCMWSNSSWKPITAEEVVKMHTNGAVSSKIGLFMCDLCGQYVSFANGDKYKPYFKHACNIDNNCPEYVSGVNYVIKYSEGEHELPLRIVCDSKKFFYFELGFIQLPEQYRNSELKIIIYSDKKHEYKEDRLNKDGLTYLDVGDKPVGKYIIKVSPSTDDLERYWPKCIAGVDAKGTIFDADSGKKKAYDDDVEVGKTYYLLKKDRLEELSSNNLSIEHITRYNGWNLYKVVVNEFDEKTAAFFLQYHCRLTDRPIRVQMVWPVYVQNPYIIKHDKDEVFVHIMGNVKHKTMFPYNRTLFDGNCSDGIVWQISVKSRQQLIYAGRSRPLFYSYFWKEKGLTNRLIDKMESEVVDADNIEIVPGKYNEFPRKGILKITVPYDGILFKKRHGNIFEKRKLSAGKLEVIHSINTDIELEVYIGLDMVWKAMYVYEKKSKHYLEGDFKGFSGQLIPIAHTAGVLANNLEHHSKLRQYLYQCIRIGCIDKGVYLYLKYKFSKQ